MLALPMLANREIPVSGLVELRSGSVGEENVVGVKLPLLVGVECALRPYSMLAKPHWVDVLVECLGTYKNFNYSASETPEYGRYRQEMEELAAKFRIGGWAAHVG